AINSRMRTTHPAAPWGAGPFLPFGRTSLNLAISAMVASRLMTRLRFAVLLLAAMCACVGKAPMPDAFAETIAGWRRTGVRDVPPSQPPDAIPANSIEGIRAATYERSGKLEARIYALPSPAVALDVAQRWPPSAD